MTVERDEGIIRFACDGARCRKNYEADADDFRAAWAEAKEHGWVNAEDRGTWYHFCPTCKKQLGD